MKHSNNLNQGAKVPGAAIELRPHNLKELSALYCISARTLKKWLLPFEKKIGKRTGYYYTIPQVRKIFSFLGFPCMFYEEGENAG